MIEVNFILNIIFIILFLILVYLIVVGVPIFNFMFEDLLKSIKRKKNIKDIVNIEITKEPAKMNRTSFGTPFTIENLRKAYKDLHKNALEEALTNLALTTQYSYPELKACYDYLNHNYSKEGETMKDLKYMTDYASEKGINLGGVILSHIKAKGNKNGYK